MALKINQTKTNVVHFRKTRKSRTEFKFLFEDNQLLVVERYEYLGLVLNEFLSFQKSVDMLTESAGRAFGAIIGKFKNYMTYGLEPTLHFTMLV